MAGAAAGSVVNKGSAVGEGGGWRSAGARAHDGRLEHEQKKQERGASEYPLTSVLGSPGGRTEDGLEPTRQSLFSFVVPASLTRDRARPRGRRRTVKRRGPLLLERAVRRRLEAVTTAALGRVVVVVVVVVVVGLRAGSPSAGAASRSRETTTRPSLGRRAAKNGRSPAKRRRPRRGRGLGWVLG